MAAFPHWHRILADAAGLAERPGPASEPRILAMARQVAAASPRLGWIAEFYTGDDIPWCGLAVAWAMTEADISPPLPNPLSARTWGNWGVQLTHPVPGCVLVFTRAGGGHVGLYEGEDADSYLVLGGNQRDRIGRDRIAKTRLLRAADGTPTGLRWPASVPIPSGAAPLRTDGIAPLSTNER